MLMIFVRSLLECSKAWRILDAARDAVPHRQLVDSDIIRVKELTTQCTGRSPVIVHLYRA